MGAAGQWVVSSRASSSAKARPAGAGLLTAAIYRECRLRSRQGMHASTSAYTGLHSSIYKQVLCLWFAAGPLNSSFRANPPSHVTQSTSSISHFFLSLHSSQLLLRLWIPWRKRGNNFLQGHRVCSSLRKQKNGVGC